MRYQVGIAGILILLLLQAACSAGRGETLSRQAAVDAAWNELAPATSSKNRDAWQVSRVEQLAGKKVDEAYRSPDKYCGWALPDAKAIQDDGEYWLVVFEPKPATPVPGEKLSPTDPPDIPEPMLREAGILLDAKSGELISYQLSCVVY